MQLVQFVQFDFPSRTRKRVFVFFFAFFVNNGRFGGFVQCLSRIFVFLWEGRNEVRGCLCQIKFFVWVSRDIIIIDTFPKSCLPIVGWFWLYLNFSNGFTVGTVTIWEFCSVSDNGVVLGWSILWGSLARLGRLVWTGVFMWHSCLVSFCVCVVCSAMGTQDFGCFGWSEPRQLLGRGLFFASNPDMYWFNSWAGIIWSCPLTRNLPSSTKSTDGLVAILIPGFMEDGQNEINLFYTSHGTHTNLGKEILLPVFLQNGCRPLVWDFIRKTRVLGHRLDWISNPLGRTICSVCTDFWEFLYFSVVQLPGFVVSLCRFFWQLGSCWAVE